MGRFLAWTLGIYLGICIVLLALESWFLYRGARADQEWVEPPDPALFEDITLTSTDGNTIHAWWTQPEGWTPDKGALHYSHGNAGNLSHRGRSLQYYRSQGHAVLIYDYPGYGKSSGRPSEAGLYAAGDVTYRWLTETRKIPASRIVLYGGSLGGTVATEMATRHPCRALVLVAAFTSFPDMAQRRFPFVPARWFVWHQMNNKAKIATLKCPVFLTHGTADQVVPYAMGEQLYEVASEPKEFLSQPGKGHNDAASKEFFEAMTAFLARVAS